jgi:hypothetical protein
VAHISIISDEIPGIDPQIILYMSQIRRVKIKKILMVIPLKYMTQIVPSIEVIVGRNENSFPV